MAQIRFDVDGNIVQYFQNDSILNSMGTSTPPEITSAISFDESVNTALANDISDNLKLYTNSAGVLKKSGVVVTINSPGQDYLDSSQLTTLRNILSPNSGAITLAQAKVMFRIIFKSLNKAGLL